MWLVIMALIALIAVLPPPVVADGLEAAAPASHPQAERLPAASGHSLAVDPVGLVNGVFDPSLIRTELSWRFMPGRLGLEVSGDFRLGFVSFIEGELSYYSIGAFIGPVAFFGSGVGPLRWWWRARAAIVYGAASGAAAGGDPERESMLSPGGEVALGFDWAFGNGGGGPRSGRWFVRPYASLRYMLGVPSGYLSAYLGLAL